MNTRTTTAPTVEPLTLAETKVHLREDLTDDVHPAQAWSDRITANRCPAAPAHGGDSHAHR